MGIAPKRDAIHHARPAHMAEMNKTREAVMSIKKINPATQRGWVNGMTSSERNNVSDGKVLDVKYGE
jgi:hypothetical protein